MKPRNDRALALSAFCLEIEKHRRTPEGRVRNAEGFLHFYFPRQSSGKAATDRLFPHLPREVRGPILAGWRIRGLKAAIRDDDERVKDVVLDALEAGDVDATMFEDGVVPDTLIDYVPLDEWWRFWRGAALPNAAVQRALATARAMHLIDDAWFLDNVQGRGGKLKGTDAVCDTLTKDDVTGWIRGIHASGDGTPSGIVAARGWENVLAKTSPDALLAALDAFARKVHLIPAPETATAAVPQPVVQAVVQPAPQPVVPPAPQPVAQPAPQAAPQPAPSPPSGSLLDGFEGMPQVDLSQIDPDAAPIGGWGDDPPPQSMPGEMVGDDEIETISTPHRPPPLPK